jgi:hypothetical protein
LALERQYPNPAALSADGIRLLLEAAYQGDSTYVTVID